jgi:hypothetical protein
MDKAVLDRNLSAVASLRSEIFTLEKELTKQKVKGRALEEELQNPLNIHRWRKLEVSFISSSSSSSLRATSYASLALLFFQGTDPNTYELIAKIQLLQKRVLSKSEIAAEKEQQLKDLETLYENLRTTTSKLSPAEVSNKIFFLRKELEEKKKKIKVHNANVSHCDKGTSGFHEYGLILFSTEFNGRNEYARVSRC